MKQSTCKYNEKGKFPYPKIEIHVFEIAMDRFRQMGIRSTLTFLSWNGFNTHGNQSLTHKL